MCDLDKEFNRIVKDNIDNQVKEYTNTLKKCKEHINNVACPDQFVGTVELNDKVFSWKLPILTSDDFKDETLKRKRKSRNGYLVGLKNKKGDKLPIITIVLESPHRGEYYLNKRNKNVAIGPACENTGKNIKKYLCEVLNQIEDEDKSNLIGRKCLVKLVNAIQYQCSLGQSTELLRTANFNSCWTEKFTSDFRDRLQKSKSTIIINCCTESDGNLKGKVRPEIKKVIGGIPLYECNHPSSWGWIDAVLKNPNLPKS